MNSVQTALANYRTGLLGVVILILATLLGILAGFQLGSKSAEEKATHSVALYAEASYRACKIQENALNGHNSQASRRSCDYLKLPLKDN